MLTDPLSTHQKRHVELARLRPGFSCSGFRADGRWLADLSALGGGLKGSGLGEKGLLVGQFGSASMMKLQENREFEQIQRLSKPEPGRIDARVSGFREENGMNISVAAVHIVQKIAEVMTMVLVRCGHVHSCRRREAACISTHQPRYQALDDPWHALSPYATVPLLAIVRRLRCGCDSNSSRV